QTGRSLWVLWDHGQCERLGRVLLPGDGLVAAVAVAPFVGGPAVVGCIQRAAGASGAARAAGGPLGSLDVADRGSDEPYARVGQVRMWGRARGRPLGRPGAGGGYWPRRCSGSSLPRPGFPQTLIRRLSVALRLGRSQWFGLIGVALLCCSLAQADEAEDRSEAFLQTLRGAYVRRDDKAPSQPVV